MRRSWVSLGVLSFLLIGASAFARNYSYPKDEPVFSIDFPDTWKVRVDAEDVAILAHSPDKEIEYNIWEVPDKKVKADVTAALNESVKEVNEIIEQYVTKTTFGEWKSEKINGMEFLWAEGKGKDKDDGQTVFIEVNFFSPDEKSVYVLIFWGTKEGEKKYRAEIEKIDHSIKKAK